MIQGCGLVSSVRVLRGRQLQVEAVCHTARACRRPGEPSRRYAGCREFCAGAEPEPHGRDSSDRPILCKSPETPIWRAYGGLMDFSGTAAVGDASMGAGAHRRCAATTRAATALVAVAGVCAVLAGCAAGTGSDAGAAPADSAARSSSGATVRALIASRAKASVTSALSPRTVLPRAARPKVAAASTVGEAVPTVAKPGSAVSSKPSATAPTAARPRATVTTAPGPTTRPKPPDNPLPASAYANCTALRAYDPHGVGRPGAVDHTSGRPVTNFLVSAAQYQAAMAANPDLDRDGDGIACEAH